MSDQLNTSPEMCIYWHDQTIKANHKVAELEAWQQRALHLLKRYRQETPPGHQPHMICHVADEIIAAAERQAESPAASEPGERAEHHKPKDNPTAHYAHDVRGLVYRVEDADRVIFDLRDKVEKLQAHNADLIRDNELLTIIKDAITDWENQQ